MVIGAVGDSEEQTVIVDLDAVADELYELAPARFTKARDARIAEAREDGDRQTADALKTLRKPSLGAWAANLLVRARGDEVEHLIALGKELQDAQERLDGDTMRRLTNEGRDAVSDLVDHAVELVDDHGERVSAAARQELEATLDAALMDPEAASTLRTARLTSGLRYSGLGLALAGSPGRSRSASPKGSGAGGAGLGPRRSERSAAERDRQVAHRELSKAEAKEREAMSALSDAEARLNELKQEIDAHRRHVREAKAAARAAEKRVASLEARRP